MGAHHPRASALNTREFHRRSARLEPRGGLRRSSGHEDFPDGFTCPDVGHVVRPSQWDRFRELILAPIIADGLPPHEEAEAEFRESQMDDIE